MSATSRYAKWEAAGGPRIIQKIDNGFTARKMLRLVRFARWHHPRHWAVPITGPKTMTPWYVPSRAESLSRHWIHWVTRLLWLFNHTLGPQQIKTLLAQARENMRPKNLCHIQTVRTPQVYPEGVSKPGDSPGDVPPPAAGWKGEWWEAPDAPGSKPAWAP